jgi:hypothetical protein
MHTKGLGHLVKGQHPFVAETIKARFKSIGGADLGDNGDSELSPKRWLIAAGIECASNLCVRVILHQSVNLTHDGWIELGEFGRRLRASNGEALGTTTTEADMEGDLIFLEESYVLNEESYHAFAQLCRGFRVPKESGKVGG